MKMVMLTERQAARQAACGHHWEEAVVLPSGPAIVCAACNFTRKVINGSQEDAQ